MDCPTCGTPMVVFDVPSVYRGHVPEDAARAGLCPECLSFAAADGAQPGTGTEPPGFDRISDAFPTDEAAAVPLAIAIGLLDSLALHRADIESLLDAVEAAGTDPLLVLDRLHAQGGVQPDFDISRRRHQLEQLLD